MVFHTCKVAHRMENKDDLSATVSLTADFGPSSQRVKGKTVRSLLSDVLFAGERFGRA